MIGGLRWAPVLSRPHQLLDERATIWTRHLGRAQIVLWEVSTLHLIGHPPDPPITLDIKHNNLCNTGLRLAMRFIGFSAAGLLLGLALAATTCATATPMDATTVVSIAHDGALGGVGLQVRHLSAPQCAPLATAHSTDSPLLTHHATYRRRAPTTTSSSRTASSPNSTPLYLTQSISTNLYVF